MSLKNEDQKKDDAGSERKYNLQFLDKTVMELEKQIPQKLASESAFSQKVKKTGLLSVMLSFIIMALRPKLVVSMNLKLAMANVCVILTFSAFCDLL